MKNRVFGPEGAGQEARDVRAGACDDPFQLAAGALDRPIAGQGVIHPHRRIHTDITERVMNPIGGASSAAVRVGVIELKTRQLIRRSQFQRAKRREWLKNPQTGDRCSGLVDLTQPPVGALGRSGAYAFSPLLPSSMYTGQNFVTGLRI